MKAQGKTIIIITHKLEEVLAISDEVTVMRDGKVVGNVQTSDTNAQHLARMIVGRDVLLRVEKTEAKPSASAGNSASRTFPRTGTSVDFCWHRTLQRIRYLAFIIVRRSPRPAVL